MSEFLRSRALPAFAGASLLLTACANSGFTNHEQTNVVPSPKSTELTTEFIVQDEAAKEDARKNLRPEDMSPWTQWGVDENDLISLEDLHTGDTYCTVGSINGYSNEKGTSKGEFKVTGDVRRIDDLSGYPDYLKPSETMVVPVKEFGRVLLFENIETANYVIASHQGLDDGFIYENDFNPIYRSFEGPCPDASSAVFA